MGSAKEKPVEIEAVEPAEVVEPAEAVLEGARPNVFKRLMDSGMGHIDGSYNNIKLVFYGKAMEVYDKISGHPQLKRERAQKEANEHELALEQNRTAQKTHSGDPAILQKLRDEESGLERGLVGARQKLGREEIKEAKFKNGRRFFEDKARTVASNGLQKIDSRLAPYEQRIVATNASIERSGARLRLINGRLDEYEKNLAEKRAEIIGVRDPIERKKLEVEIGNLMSMAKSRRRVVGRVIERQKKAQKDLKKNEAVALPLRENHRHFARAAGLEVSAGVLSKGSPPEDLPVMPSTKIETVADKAVIVEAHYSKPESNIYNEKVDRFIDSWNKLVWRSAWKIEDLGHFRFLAKDRTAPVYAVRKYFEDMFTIKGLRMTEGQYNKVDSIANQVSSGVHVEETFAEIKKNEDARKKHKENKKHAK